MSRYNSIVKSPLNYSGNKYKLMPQILLHIPKHIDVFVDLFGGTGTVGANISCNTLIYNEYDKNIYNIFNMLAFNEPRELIQQIHNKIDIFSLSKNNKKSYYQYKAYYNQNPSVLDLYLLSCYSFSNLIRFNSSGFFNVPFGSRQFSINMQKNISSFFNAMKTKNLQVYNCDFEKIEILPNYFVYLDPPYLNSGAIYNEKNGWGIEEEERMRNYLDSLTKQGVKWALSNDLHKNPTLFEWAFERYKIIDLHIDYSTSFYNTKTIKGETKEVLIINY
jgi:DNA adenine methylase Dam